MPNDKECPGPSAQYWDYEGEQPHRDTCAKNKCHLVRIRILPIYFYFTQFKQKWQPDIATTFHFGIGLFAFRCFAFRQFIHTAIAGDGKIFRIARHFQSASLMILWLKIDRHHSLGQTKPRCTRCSSTKKVRWLKSYWRGRILELDRGMQNDLSVRCRSAA